jgi:nucleotide-binding universal stress UspA family protein
VSTPWTVVGWTPDQYGEVALQFALADARTYGRGIVIVNGTKGDALVDDRYAGAEQLDVVRAMLDESGVPHDVRQSMGVDVAEQVLGVAEEVGARLIVLGLRRRTPVGKLLMGSVAQRVILDAKCPVLCVKPGSRPD